MTGDNVSSLDLTAPCFSQGELCEVAGITNATANNWIHSGLLKPANMPTRRSRKPRMFSVITIFHARVTGTLVEKFRIQASTAASIAEATTKNQSWMSSIIHKQKHNIYWTSLFATVSERESEWDIFFNSPEDSKLFIAIKTGPVSKERTEIQTGPYLVFSVSEDFASVYKQCEAILSDESSREA